MTGKIPETAPSDGFPDSSFKYTPVRHVRVMFIRFCQGLFHAAPLGCYRWDPDENKTEIVISNENKLDSEVINRRPGLHFTRGPLQFYSLGIDDMLHYEWDIDKKTKAVLVPGTMTINCVSRVQQESEDLAWVVMEHIWLLRHLLMRAGFFEIGRQPQMGSPSPAGSIVANDQGDEFVSTPVSIPFQFSRTSSFTPLGKRIVQSIDFSLNYRPTPKYVGVQGLPFSQHFNGSNNVKYCPPESFAPDASDAQGLTPDPAGQRQVFLPKQPHPLNPAQTVSVRTVRTQRPARLHPAGSVPITDPCVEESGT